MPPRSLHWSASPADLLPSVMGRRPVAFAVHAGGALRARRRGLRVALMPLEDLRDGRVLGDTVNGWLVWQSVSCGGCVTRLPCDVDALAAALHVPRGGGGGVPRSTF
jgi:hypothetical protein